MSGSGEKLSMDNLFFERPILNSPYKYPARYWELDKQGQPTQHIIESRRRAEFITPIPKPRKRKGAAEKISKAPVTVSEPTQSATQWSGCWLACYKRKCLPGNCDLR